MIVRLYDTILETISLTEVDITCFHSPVVLYSAKRHDTYLVTHFQC